MTWKKTGAQSQSTSCPPKASAQKTTFRQALLLVLAVPLLFFALLEGGLFLFGVEPVLRSEDPFVGFAGNVPLFVEDRAPNGLKMRVTAENKQHLFNRQMFIEKKAPDTYRIFCLGGSTTYGRPYNDLTSFAGWLRELLPAVDPRRDWEVINAGGISYASYRVARLMEELVQYRPDLLIIYTGQNEFLEERTYGKLRNVPEFVRSTLGVLAETRTWAALNSALGSVGLIPGEAQSEGDKLAAEVDAILDHSTGPNDYRRDDDLQKGVVEHFRVGLRRMADIAREAGAKVIFVTPASNLKDCSPFKSEHTAGLDAAQQQKSEHLLTTALNDFRKQSFDSAGDTLEEAIALDPRYAEHHFLMGKILLAQQRYDEAKRSFQRARDEDVCPLRALPPMPDIVREVAQNEGLALVDFVSLIERATLAETGHSIPGEEYFLDHVHPTVDGHKMLAVSLVEKMISKGIVEPGGRWNNSTIASVDARIKSRIDPHMQAQALINLAKVLHWAGKKEDAQRLAGQALTAAGGDGRLVSQASNILVKIARAEKDWDQADHYIRAALSADPRSPVMHYQWGMRLLQQERRQKGVAHILYASAFWEDNETTSVLGLILYDKGRPELARPLLEKALEYDHTDRISRTALTDLQKRYGESGRQNLPVEISVSRYPSGAPKEVFVGVAGAAGRTQPEGLYSEWYENGALKRYAEYVNGARHGVETQWSKSGEVEYTAIYEKGRRTDG